MEKRSLTSRASPRNHGALDLTDRKSDSELTSRDGVIAHSGDNCPVIECNGNFPPTSDTRQVGDQPKKEMFKVWQLPRRSQLTLLLCCTSIFFSGCQFFFMVPFLQTEAADKDMSVTFVAAILSIMNFTVFLTSPIYGSLMPEIGAKFMYIAGAGVAGSATILFGFVDMCSPGAAFAVTSVLCRFVMSCGVSAFITAGFTILSNEFPDHVATAFGLGEVANGIGFMIGPVIGGVIYEVGGFKLPFFVIGGLVLVNALFLYLVLPPPIAKPSPSKGSLVQLSSSSLVKVGIVGIFLGAIPATFVDATLVTRLEQFDLSTAVIGLMFTLAPLFYGVTSPFIGYLTDVKGYVATLTCFGSFLCGLAYLILAPCPGLDFLEDELWLVIISLGMVGTGFAAIGISIVKCMVMGAIEVGFANNLDTYGLVSGVFFSSFSLGGGLGSLLGGVLVERFGFRFAAMLVALLQLIMLVFNSIYFGGRRQMRKRREKRKAQGWDSSVAVALAASHDEAKLVDAIHRAKGQDP